MIFAVVVATFTSGCFLGYDSRWGQAEDEQRNSAKRRTPDRLQARGLSEHGPVKELALRVYATPRHVAQAVNWRRQLDDRVADANAILEADFGVRLRIDSAREWPARRTGENASELISELRDFDHGEDVAWVVALAGRVPRAEVSFQALGVAYPLSKHLVVRAANDAAELDSIERQYTELDQKERERLYRKRKRHKAAAVLLHELGHTLGALHTRERDGLMHTVYGHHMLGFSSGNVALIKAGLLYRTNGPLALRESSAEQMRTLTESGVSSWAPEEYEQMLASLRHYLPAEERRKTAPPSAPPAATTVHKPSAPSAPTGPTKRPTRPVVHRSVSSEPDAVPSELSPEESLRFRAARRQKQAGDTREASKTLSPLVKKYPHVFEVQELRCQIAMARGGNFGWIRSECRPMKQLLHKSN